MSDLKVFLLIIILGTLSEVIFYKGFWFFTKKKIRSMYSHRIWQDISVVAIPVLGFIYLLIQKNTGYIKLFILSAIIGTVVEYFLGRFLHLAEKKKVWEYHYLQLGQYTSWLSLPYWGGAGLLFFWIDKFVGV